MPTAAFLEAAESRLRAGQKISTFALTFPKDQMFALGARPVIYSLHDPTIPTPSGAGGGPRIFPAAVLPLNEQYRYVTYSLTASTRVDCTHEREWRWPHPEVERDVREADEEPAPPCLNVYESGITDIGAIVKTREDGGRVIHDMLCLVDRSIVGPETFSYVLVAGELIPSAIRSREEEDAAIAAATIDLNNFLVPQAGDQAIRDRVYEIAREIETAAGEPQVGEFGGCWLWLVDNTHRVTRALVNCQDEEERDVLINRGGKYLIFPYEFSDSRSLRQREEMTQELARRVEAEFGVKAGYFSVLGSDDHDGLPSYNTDMLDDRMHYNWASEGRI